MAKVERYPMSAPEFPADMISLSDAKFLWGTKREGPSRTYHPNPSRLYGLYEDSLRVYIESYVPIEVAGSGDLQFRMVVFDEKGVSISSRPAARSTRGFEGGGTWPASGRGGR